MSMTPALTIVFIVILLISLIIHEVAHGWTANKLGDPTAKLQGRLSLNPIRHIDPIGSIVVPGILLITNSGFLFGWAKPVPFNPYNLKNPRRDEAIIALAGPVSNVLLALFATLIYRALEAFSIATSPFIVQTTLLFVLMNLILAFFNMLPIPPLDGSKILFSLLPQSMAHIRNTLESFGFLLIIILIATGALGFLFSFVNALAHLLLFG